MGRTGISVKNLSLEEAILVSREFSRNGVYLRDLVSRYVPEDTREPVDDMDYSQLLHYGYVVKGVADRMVRTSRRARNLRLMRDLEP